MWSTRRLLSSCSQSAREQTRPGCRKSASVANYIDKFLQWHKPEGNEREMSSKQDGRNRKWNEARLIFGRSARELRLRRSDLRREIYVGVAITTLARWLMSRQSSDIARDALLLCCARFFFLCVLLFLGRTISFSLLPLFFSSDRVPAPGISTR